MNSSHDHEGGSAGLSLPVHDVYATALVFQDLTGYGHLWSCSSMRTAGRAVSRQKLVLDLGIKPNA